MDIIQAKKIKDMISTQGFDATQATLGISDRTWRRYRAEIAKLIPDAVVSKVLCPLDKIDKFVEVAQDKKKSSVNWREWVQNMKDHQELHNAASSYQKSANPRIVTNFRYLVLKPLADAHLGNMGVNYDRLSDFTDSLLRIPYLYCCLLGDDTDNFVSFKNQLPVVSQLISPQEQMWFLESWLGEIAPKILFSCWGNHAEFSERSAGVNPVASILSKNVVYFNGIGHCRINLNEVEYDIVATHCTRYGSSFNLCHGLKQMARKDAPDADIYLSAHVHQPDFEVSFERGRTQLFMVMGSLKEHDAYSERYFSYFSSREDYAIVLDTFEHRVIPMIRLRDALEFAEAGNKERLDGSITN